MTECSMEDCSAQADFLCKCLKPTPKFCESHISQHLKTEAKHRPQSLSLTSQKLTKIQKKAEKFNNSLSDLQASLEQEKAEIIKTLSENYEICIQELKASQERLKNSLQADVLESEGVSYIQTLCKLSEHDLKIELKSWKPPKVPLMLPKQRKIMTLGPILHQDFPPYFQDFSSFMWVNVDGNPGIYKFDFDDVVTVNRLKVLEKLAFVNTCQVSNELIFVSAGTVNGGKGKNFLFNSRVGEMVKVKGFGGEARNLVGMVFTDFEVYLFGGCRREETEGVTKVEGETKNEAFGGMAWVSSASKYNILTKQWKKLTDLPTPTEVSSTSIQQVKILNNLHISSNSVSSSSLILLSGFKLTKVLQYSPSSDTYSETSPAFDENKFKTLLTYQKSLFMLYNNSILLQRPSKSSWKQVGHFTFLKDCHISHQSTRTNCIIFTNNQQIWSLNTTSAEIKELSPYQTHYIFDPNTLPHKKRKTSET